MSLYAMSDLHLSFYKEKPMDIFDSVWKDHPQKILERWNSTVSEDDTVLVPGDVSWGKNLNEAIPDLEFIDNLKGKKILLTGNHDYYWNSTQKLNEMFDSMSFLKNNFYEFENYLICGTRGWICPGDTRYTDHDKKIYLREVGRLKLSLESAVNSSKFNIKRGVYGHLHGKKKYDNSLIGNKNNVEYSLVSADYLGFTPIKIL